MGQLSHRCSDTAPADASRVIEADSAGLGWRHVGLRRVRDAAECEPFDIVPGNSLSIVLIKHAAEPKARFNIERRCDQGWLGARYRAGDLGMTAPNRHASLRWSNLTPHTSVQVSLSAELLEQAARDANTRVPLDRLNRLSHHEPVVRAIVLALEAATESRAMAAYADAAAHFLAAHLIAAIGPGAGARPVGHAATALGRLDAFLHQRLSDDFSLAELAEYVGLSSFQLIRLCRAELGETPFRRLQRIRIERGRTLLQERRLNVTQIAFECGHASPSAFGSAFVRATGLSPRAYRAL